MVDIRDYVSVDKLLPGEAGKNEPKDRRDRTDQCRVVWYQWKRNLETSPLPPFPPLPTDSGALEEAEAYDISAHVAGFSYAKDLGNAAGSFSLTLYNSIEWQRYMRPGTWIVVYMSSEGDLFPQDQGDIEIPKSFNALVKQTTSKIPGFDQLKGLAGSITTKPALTPESLDKGPAPADHARWANAGYRRCLGVVQRVGMRSFTNANGTQEIEFSVTGKDFGAVFEETELWFNMWNNEQSTWGSLAKTMRIQDRNLAAALNLYYDAFFNPEAVLSKDSNLSNSVKIFREKSKQWIIPSQLKADLNLNAKYFGQIPNLKEFYPTLFELNEPNPLSGADGIAWDRLKALSEPYFHELFTEIDDTGNPKLIFRPIPWGFDKSNYPRLGAVTSTFKQHYDATPFTPSIETVGGLVSGLAADPKKALQQAFKGVTTGNPMKSRFDVATVEIESFDVGPAFHERYNFFLVDFVGNTNTQGGAILKIQQKFKNLAFPYQDNGDIQRHGFKPMRVQLQAYLNNSGTQALFGTGETKDPNTQFLFEATSLLKDYHGNADDFYSGSIMMVGNKNVKVGKILKTDLDFPGLGEMAFYVEGYTDNFTINENGTTSWTQTVDVTRGIEVKDLLGGANAFDSKSLNGEIKPHAGTFHRR